MKGQRRSNEVGTNRRWAIGLSIGIAAIVLAAAFLSSGSYFVQLSIQRWAQETGIGELRIERVEFNPLIGTLVLNDVSLHKEGKQQLRLDQVRVWMEWLPLWQRRLVAREITLRGFETAFHHTGDGTFSLAGISMGGGAVEEEEGKAWDLELDKLTLERGILQIVKGDQTTPLGLTRLELSDLSSWRRQNSATLDFSGRFAQSHVEITGSLLPFAEAPSAALKAKVNGLDLATLLSVLDIESPDIGGRFSITSGLNISYTPEAVSIAQRGSMGVDAFSLRQNKVRLEQKKIKWQGSMQINFRLAEGLYLDALGDLGLFDGQLGLDGSGTMISLEALRIPSSELAMSPGAVAWTQKGALELEQLHLVAKDLELKEEQLKWDGRATYKNELTAREGSFELAGEMRASSPILDFGSEEMRLSADAMRWGGEFKTTRKSPKTAAESIRTIDINGVLNVDQFRFSAYAGELDTLISDLSYQGEVSQKGEVIGFTGQMASGKASLNVPGADYRLVGWERLESGVLQSADLKQIEMKEMTISGMRVADMIPDSPELPPPMARALNTRLEGVRYSAELGFTVDDVLLQDVTLDLRRDGQGRWNTNLVQERITAALAGVDVTEQSQEKKPFNIKRIRVSGDSKLGFLDEGVEPPYQETYRIEELVLSDLDSYAPMQPTALKGRVRVGTHSLIQMDALLYPFKRRPDADVSMDISALEIPRISTYGEAFLGYSLDSGQVDSQLSIKIKEQKLDGLAKLQIHQLAVSPLETERRKQLDTELNVPLETALDLLRNEQNSIKLELPVTGNLDSPDFDLRDAISQATGRALKKGAMTYLAASLQPFGALVMIASAVGDAAAAVRLEPVLFQPGSLQWDERSVGYLTKVSRVLKERPELRVKICGVAVSEDRGSLRQKSVTKADPDAAEKKAISTADDELLQLASARADRVKDYLVEQHDLEPGRLISCKASLNSEEGQQPRVDLIL